nr:hypothetical protein [Tanacetum cinerariifolium]
DEANDFVKRKAKEDPAVKKYQAMKRKPQTEAQTKKSMMMYLKNVAGFKLDYFKGMFYDDIHPIFEAKFNSNVDFLLKTKEQIEKDENRALQTINKTPAERAAKRRKLNEEVEDLKIHLQIVPNEDDDNCTWSSKGKELKATRIMCCADHNLYNHTADFVSREKVPTLNIYSRQDAECWVGFKGFGGKRWERCTMFYKTGTGEKFKRLTTLVPDCYKSYCKFSPWCYKGFRVLAGLALQGL